MPAVTVQRLIATLLAASILLVASAAPAVAQEPAPTLIAPPSLPVAVASLPDADVGAAASVELAENGDRVYQPAGVVLPRCRVGDKLTRYHKVKHWRRTLLDTNLRLKRDYRPWDLVSVSRANVAGSGTVRKLMIRDLKALAAAARKAGKPLAVRSAYRSYDYQKALFASYVRTYGYGNALKFSARAGHSEHQLGTTVDFTVGPGVPLSTRFGDSPSGKWLARNGWRYGFIMSYPKGKKYASCYGYEPWHWRYFGRDLARKIHQSGQVPRRYLYVNFETAP